MSDQHSSLLTWDRSQIASDMRFAFLASRRVATVSPDDSYEGRGSWNMVFLIPGPRGLIPMERGFRTREAAKKRVEELAAEFVADMRRLLQ